jgi:hypothetical protein
VLGVSIPPRNPTLPARPVSSETSGRSYRPPCYLFYSLGVFRRRRGESPYSTNTGSSTVTVDLVDATSFRINTSVFG